MLALVDHGAAIVQPAGIDGDGGGDERARETRPGDEVLVEVVAARPWWFEDQLVLEQPRRTTVKLRQNRQYPGVVSQPGAHGGDVNDRVERLEQTLAVLAVGLPATAEVACIDKIRAGHEPLGLGCRGGNLVRGEEFA
jgi:hypothetical protein